MTASAWQRAWFPQLPLLAQKNEPYVPSIGQKCFERPLYLPARFPSLALHPAGTL